jgi:hypothetical protein
MLGLPITKEQLTATTAASEAASTSAPVTAAPAAASQPTPAVTSAPVTAATAATSQPATLVTSTPITDSDRKAGFKTVVVPRVITYHMPGMCVACGKPLNGSKATIKASATQTYGNMRTTLSLGFPLCFECEGIQKTFTSNSNKSTGISFGIAAGLVIIFLVVGLSTSTSSDKGGIWGGAICGGLIVWGIIFAIVNAIVNNQLPKPIRDQHNNIPKSVSILSFTTSDVVFKFTNESFANLFAGLNSTNSGALVNMLADLLKKKT